MAQSVKVSAAGLYLVTGSSPTATYFYELALLAAAVVRKARKAFGPEVKW